MVFLTLPSASPPSAAFPTEELAVDLVGFKGEFKAKEVFEQYARILQPRRVALSVYDAKYLREFHSVFGPLVTAIFAHCDLPELDWPALESVEVLASQTNADALFRRPLRFAWFGVNTYPKKTSSIEAIRLDKVDGDAPRFVNEAKATTLSHRRGIVTAIAMPSICILRQEVTHSLVQFSVPWWTWAFPNVRELHLSTACDGLCGELVDPLAFRWLCRLELAVGDTEWVPVLLKRELYYLRTPVVSSGFKAINAALAESKCRGITMHWKDDAPEADVLGWIRAMIKNTETRSINFPVHRYDLPSLAMSNSMKDLFRLNKTLQYLPGSILSVDGFGANRTICQLGSTVTINASRVYLSSDGWQKAALIIAFMRANKAHALRNAVFAPDCMGAIETMCSDFVPALREEKRLAEVSNIFRWNMDHHAEPAKQIPPPRIGELHVQFIYNVDLSCMMVVSVLPTKRTAADKFFDTRFAQAEIAVESMQLAKREQSHKRKW